MSIVPKETIEVIAESIGVNNLASDVLPSLASDVEYRILEIMQEAIKCMRHSRRTALTAEDVDCALNLRNVEPIYGFASGDPLRFKRAAGHKDLFYIDDQSVEFKDVIETPLPKAPLDTTVMVHWLAVEGVQPAIPENAPTEGPSDSKQSEYKEDRLSVDVKMPIKHVLSREMQLYFEKITELTMSRSSSILFNRALVSLATDSGLHPLVPYFTYFVADEVARNLNNFVLLFALMRLVCSLLQNAHLHIEPYLHQLMPSVMTCLVAKRLGNKISDNHWELRNFTAKLVGSICKRYGHVYHNLQPRVTRTLLHAFLDPTKALPQHYGAIQGLVALGPTVVRLLVLPNLEPYLQLLHSEMQLEKQKNEMKRREAWCVYGALQVAAGLCMYDGLKMLPNLVPLPTHVIWKSNVKVLTKTPNKRKASMDNLTQQPPVKKIASGVRMGVMASNALTADMQGTLGGYTKNLGNADSGLPSTQRQLPNETVAGSSGRRELADTKTSNISAHAWNKCADAGHLLPLLYEHFGESILAFVPESELSFFL